MSDKITPQLRHEAMHLRSELQSLIKPENLTFVGLGDGDFIVGLVKKSTLKDARLLKSWCGKPVNYIHAGKIRALVGQ